MAILGKRQILSQDPQHTFASSTAATLVASYHNLSAATTENINNGFRVTSLNPIPEPGTYAAIFGALLWR